MMKWLKFAVLNALRNRRRSLATLAITALGTAAVLLGGGFALFTYQSLEEASARDTGHLIVAHRQFFSDDEATPLQFGLTDASSLRERLSALPEVRHVLPRLQFSGLITNGDKSEIFMGTGVDARQEFSVKGPFLTLVSGELIGEAGPEKRGVLLGEALAKGLGAKPGSGLTLLSTTTAGALNALDVTVSGIVSTGIPDIDRRLVTTELALAQELLVTDKVSTLGVYLARDTDVNAMRETLRARFPETAIRTWSEQAVFYHSVRGLYNRIFGFLGVIVIGIVAAVIANALVMSVIERTREIGTLRALGTTPGQIVRTFALEGGFLGLLGALCGMALAFGLSIALLFANIQMPPPPGRSVGYPLAVSISSSLYAETGLVVTAIALLAAIWVSRKAARQPIVEALAHV
jgi:putative ABC transport system permease protein